MPLLFLGVIFFLSGLIFKLFPPKKINMIYGWRTSFAAKNQDTWDEAQRYGANLMIMTGIVSALVGCLLVVLAGNMHAIIGLVSYIFTVSVMILLGEVHLRRVFNSDGSRKDV